MTEKIWRINLGDEAEQDFARILRYTKVTFGDQQFEIYRVTLLEAIVALAEGPDVLGSSARNNTFLGFVPSTSPARAVADGISSCIGRQATR